MESIIEEQNNPFLYLEPISRASCEFKSAVPVLIDFIETLNSTGSPEQLQTLSMLVLKDLSFAEQYLIAGKEQMERIVCGHLTSRKQLEDDIKSINKNLEDKRRQMERKQKEFKEKEAKVDEAHITYQAEQDKYRALLQESNNAKGNFVIANTVLAGIGAFIAIATGALGASFALQSLTAECSLASIDVTGALRDSAKYDWNKSRHELSEHQKDIKELQKQSEILQTEYTSCLHEKSRVDKNYNEVLKQLNETAQVFESVLKYRHFIRIAHGKTEILQETRKDFPFQNHLRLPLVEICHHLTSTFGLESFSDPGIQQLCINLKEKVAILPNSACEDQNGDIDDYI